MVIKTCEDFEFKIRLKMRKAWLARRWSRKTFGRQWCPVYNNKGVWNVFSDGGGGYESYYSWHFKNQSDAVLFSLRWM